MTKFGKPVRAISAEDLRKFPEFSDMTSVELIERRNDSKIAPYAFNLGCNVDVPPTIQFCRHRTLDNKDTLDYRYVYPEREDYDWVHSSGCGIRSRIDMQEDTELKSDMLRMSKEGFNWPKFDSLNLTKEDTEKSYSWYSNMMKIGRAIQQEVRGGLALDEDMLEVS